MDWFDAIVQVEYAVCDWTFGTWAWFSKHAFENIYFEASGVLGAFSAYGWLDFDPPDVDFNTLYGEAAVTIAGVDLYAAFLLQKAEAVGYGFSVGGSGVAGNCKIGAYAFFNIDDAYDLLSDYAFFYGWPTMPAGSCTRTTAVGTSRTSSSRWPTCARRRSRRSTSSPNSRSRASTS
jgi:hypothetical protein